MSALFFAHILLHTHTPAAMYCAWTHFGKCIQCREVADVIHDILISLNLIDDFRMCIYIKIYVCIYSEEQKRNTLMHKRKPHILSFWSSFSDKIIRNGYRGERESQREKSRHCMVCTHTYKLNEKKSPIFTHKYLCVVFSLTFTKGHEITCTTAMATTTAAATSLMWRKKIWIKQILPDSKCIEEEEEEEEIQKWDGWTGHDWIFPHFILSFCCISIAHKLHSHAYTALPHTAMTFLPLHYLFMRKKRRIILNFKSNHLMRTKFIINLVDDGKKAINDNNTHALRHQEWNSVQSLNSI